MKKTMIKILVCTLCAVLICATFASCNSEKSISLKVGTGDNIKVTFDTTDGYTLNWKDDVLLVKDKDGASIMEGSFINKSTYDDYKNIIGKDITLASGKEKTYEYILHILDKNDKMRQQLLAKIYNTKTAIALTVYRPASEAKELIKRISFEKAPEKPKKTK